MSRGVALNRRRACRGDALTAKRRGFPQTALDEFAAFLLRQAFVPDGIEGSTFPARSCGRNYPQVADVRLLVERQNRSQQLERLTMPHRNRAYSRDFGYPVSIPSGKTMALEVSLTCRVMA